MHKLIQRLTINITTLLILLTSSTAIAKIPEPDVIYYGAAVMNGSPFTANDTNVQIRAEINGTPVVSYTMGDRSNAGDYYVLYIPMDSMEPPEPNSAHEGDTVFIFLSSGGQDYHVARLTIGTRGSITEFALDATDTDNDGLANSVDNDDDDDGLPDPFEQQYGYNPFDSNDATTDWDHDGINALAEFLKGTNPNSFDSDNDGIDDDKDTDPLQSNLPIVLTAGLNLFALPVTPTSGLTSADILTEFGESANSVSRIDLNGMEIEKTTIIDNTIAGTIFLITEGQGYLVDMANNHQQLWSGPLSLRVPDLVTGTNVVTFPTAPEGLTAHLLIDQIDTIGSIASVQRFNSKSGRFETAVYNQNIPSGFNFSIQRGEAYILSMHQDVTGLELPQAPLVTISSPALGIDVALATIDVVGTVDDSDALVQVNGIVADIFGGEYIANEVPLQVGVNTLTVTAKNSLGLISRTQQRVLREP